jgi:hypothetical protein
LGECGEYQTDTLHIHPSACDPKSSQISSATIAQLRFKFQKDNLMRFSQELSANEFTLHLSPAILARSAGFQPALDGKTARTAQISERLKPIANRRSVKISNPSAAGRVAGPNNFLESSERSVIIGPVVVAAEAKARYSVVRGTSP